MALASLAITMLAALAAIRSPDVVSLIVEASKVMVLALPAIAAAFLGRTSDRAGGLSVGAGLLVWVAVFFGTSAAPWAYAFGFVRCARSPGWSSRR